MSIEMLDSVLNINADAVMTLSLIHILGVAAADPQIAVALVILQQDVVLWVVQQMCIRDRCGRLSTGNS